MTDELDDDINYKYKNDISQAVGLLVSKGERMSKRGVISISTSICEPSEANLAYRGVAIETLVTWDFFRVAYLLLHGKDDANDLPRFKGIVVESMERLPEAAVRCMDNLPPDTDCAKVLQYGLNRLAMLDSTPDDHSPAAVREKGEKLLGQLAGLTSAWACRRANRTLGKPLIQNSHGPNLLMLMTGSLDTSAGQLLDKALILCAEHGLAPSTFAARVIASTRADLHSAVSGAIGALSGSRHGGAARGAFDQFQRIGSRDRVDRWLKDFFANQNPGDRIMGFGHSRYTKVDVRYRELASLFRKAGTIVSSTWIAIAGELEDALANRKPPLYANLDLALAFTLKELEIPPSIFTAVFACGRCAGWCAHVIEQYIADKPIRPVADYRGP